METQFKHYKITVSNGYSWNTCINPNCSHETVVKSFLNQWFDVGSYPVENMQQCIAVEYLGIY